MKAKEKLTLLTIATARLVDAIKEGNHVSTALDQAEAAVNHLVLGTKKKQPTRLLKAICNEETGGCGYTLRISRSWLDVAIPLCPNNACEKYKKPMDAETEATTADERVNVYHKSKDNSLSRIIDAEGGKRELSGREKRKKANEQTYVTRRVGEDDIPW